MNSKLKSSTLKMTKGRDPDEIKILIVDDDPQLRKLLGAVVGGMGYSVKIAESGDAALPILQRENFDLVLSDVMMPGISGLELLEQVKKNTPMTDVIIMTASPKVYAAVEAMKIGALDYISKPFELGEMKEKILKAVKYKLQNNFESQRKIAGCRVIRTLGEGSMGMVFLVEKDGISGPKQYALKIIKKEIENKELIERLLKEANTVSSLNHDNIISVIDHGFAEKENIPFLLMEYCNGKTLKKIIQEKIEYKLEKKVDIILQAAKGLQVAHSKNVVHRDIKPDNIMVDVNNKVKIMDFGICQVPDSDQTNMFRMLGTPYYQAPESYKSPKVSFKADIYSLGVVAYEFFLGVKPYVIEDSSNINVLGYKILTENPVEPILRDKHFPLNLQVILQRMLMKNPLKRYEKTQDLVNDLKKLQAEGFKQKKLFQRSNWNTL